MAYFAYTWKWKRGMIFIIIIVRECDLPSVNTDGRRKN